MSHWWTERFENFFVSTFFRLCSLLLFLCVMWSALTFSWLRSAMKMFFSLYSSSLVGSCQYWACTELHCCFLKFKLATHPDGPLFVNINQTPRIWLDTSSARTAESEDSGVWQKDSDVKGDENSQTKFLKVCFSTQHVYTYNCWMFLKQIRIWLVRVSEHWIEQSIEKTAFCPHKK